MGDRAIITYNHFKEILYFARFVSKEEFIPEPTKEQAERAIALMNDRHCSDYYVGFDCKAFNIWYELIKQHFFENGNKRIGLLCFIYYCILNYKAPLFKGNPVDFCREIAISKPDEEPKDSVISCLKNKVSFADF